MDINFKGALFTVQKAVPLMPKTAVFNTSINNQMGMPNSGICSKAALRSLVRVSCQLLERGIRVNAVSPGPVKPLLSAKPEFQEQLEQVTTRLQRVPNSDNRKIAKAVLFLASDGIVCAGRRTGCGRSWTDFTG